MLINMRYVYVIFDVEGMILEECRINYNCDIIYVMNSEFGFDFFWDNLVIVSLNL